MGRRERKRSPQVSREDTEPAADEEPLSEPLSEPPVQEEDEPEFGFGRRDDSSAAVTRVTGFIAVLLVFVVIAIWNPGHGVSSGTWGFKHKLKKKPPKHMWPSPEDAVPGCTPVGNVSRSRPPARMSRVFLLQRDERKNLADMINYHRQAFSPDQIVILDHRSEDSLTKRVLQRFSQVGGHVWRCERDYAQHRADMMSRVMKLYAPYSTYLIPLEADEMLALHTQNDTLDWSSAALSSALASLPDSAKMFKARTTAGVPHDCPNMPLSEEQSESALVAEKCLGAAKPLDGFSCGSRTFYRGDDFAATDDRNTIGATTAQPDPLKNAGACVQGGLEPLYHRSPLVIIHFQVGSLNDLVMRVMRQAARLSPARCNQKDRPHVSSEIKELQMYCQWHATISKAELNLTAIRPRYERTYCAPPETLVSLQAALRRACFPPTSAHSLVPVGGM